MNYSSVTGNVDNLEGGLDGVVQAIVCTRQVGWAHQARKLMLVATDGLLHFAGEGKVRSIHAVYLIADEYSRRREDRDVLFLHEFRATHLTGEILFRKNAAISSPLNQ